MIIHLTLFAVAFGLIWLGAGLAITAVEKLSKHLKLSSFAVSFLLLGFFTSISEFSVGINAIIDQDPEIYVGNLIGASIVICLLLIPLLAINGNILKINANFRNQNLPLALIVIAAPVIFVLDGQVSFFDSFSAIVLYAILVVSIQKKKGVLEKLEDFSFLPQKQVWYQLLKIIAGITIIFIASSIVVDQTIYFSRVFNLSPFLISLIFLSIGTNLPELSLVVRSAFLKNNEVAFGDYIGSASFNTFLFGFLTLLNQQPIQLNNNYLTSLIFLFVGLIAFYFFAQSKGTISKKEGFALLAIYIIFLLSEIVSRH